MTLLRLAKDCWLQSRQVGRRSYNRVTLTASGKIYYLRSAMLGDDLTAAATEDYRGRRRGFYTVKITNQNGDAVALFRGRAVSRDEPVVQLEK